MNRPPPTAGLRHIALFVNDLEATEAFYTELMGMAVEWRPDAENVYLTSGNDNLALHRAAKPVTDARLDHVGFFVNHADEVDQWCRFLSDAGVRVQNEPRTHRDGARSFYCLDPDGTRVQIIFHPPIADAAS